MDAETIKAWMPAILAVIALLSSAVTGYFGYITNKKADTALKQIHGSTGETNAKDTFRRNTQA